MATFVEITLKFLKEHPNKKYTANELSQKIIESFPKFFNEKSKRTNKYGDELIKQVAREIGAYKNKLSKSGVEYLDNPSPRRYFFEIKTEAEYVDDDKSCDENIIDDHSIFKEKDLYLPIMKEYFGSELNLYSMRIDENTSKKSRGRGGNHWLHPDIVAMECFDQNWCHEVKACLEFNRTERINLWSFEVKMDLITSNFREAFFQAVSNSSWANQGYLVCTSFSNEIANDLKILSDLHGIGIITINLDDFSDSRITYPAKIKSNIDWKSVNRLAEENPNFKDFITRVSDCLKLGSTHRKLWDGCCPKINI